MGEGESLDRAIERLLSDQSPRDEVQYLDDEARDMLRMAQLIRGSRDGAPTPEFVERLHDELFPPVLRISRRTAFLSGLGALAAGLAAGLGIERATQRNGASNDESAGSRVPLVFPNRGKWIHVADVADVPEGAVRPFTAGAVQGVLINSGGNLRAMSSICTHMGCALALHDNRRYFQCPCHGAEFDLSGKLRYGAGGYKELPSLPRIRLKVKGEKILVFGA
jgi:nitrite reductase/ring-hydroxylating ferredoxin subunit